ncbi:MAG: rod shape-determining protein RodA, partial [Candidatus Doudnabacteria bacterium]|nr:rod shape-determining protein RodA [Candidatus Doudnabacteria bacterium]
LLLLGLLMIYSTTLEAGSGLMLRQVIFATIGLAALFALAFYDYRNLKKTTAWLYSAIVLALIYVYFFSTAIRGSSRWIDLGFFQLQPAEFAKLFMVVIMAKFLDKSGEKLKSFHYVLLSAVYVGIPALLILIEPDLGSSVVIVGTWLAMLFFSPMKKKQIMILIGILIVMLALAWNFALHDYQKQRVFTFLNPQTDPAGSGYNAIQSIIAVGSGGLWGRGLGRGFQSQLKFLPERQTDFIFASTAEELGLLGSMVVLGLFFVIFYRLIKVVKSARDNFGMYLSLGIFFMFLIQVLINIGMNIGVVPVTGIPLPLLSYGGSSLITTFLALGVIQSIVARSKAVKFRG